MPIEDEYKYVHQIIDNAPAVEAYTPEQVKELVDLNKKLSEEVRKVRVADDN